MKVVMIYETTKNKECWKNLYFMRFFYIFVFQDGWWWFPNRVNQALQNAKQKFSLDPSIIP